MRMDGPIMEGFNPLTERLNHHGAKLPTEQRKILVTGAKIARWWDWMISLTRSIHCNMKTSWQICDFSHIMATLDGQPVQLRQKYLKNYWMAPWGWHLVVYSSKVLLIFPCILFLFMQLNIRFTPFNCTNMNDSDRCIIYGAENSSLSLLFIEVAYRLFYLCPFLVCSDNSMHK